MLIHHSTRDIELTARQTDEAMGMCLDYGIYPDMAEEARILRGWTLVEQGRGAEGLVLLRQGIAARQTIGAVVFLPFDLGLLAEAYRKEGQVEEGLQALAEALSLTERTGVCWQQAELFRLKGELVLHHTSQNLTSRTPEAETWFRKALEIAHRQEAKSFELRATTSLARLWQGQGKRVEARELLAPVYNWFTEGFDTADLKDAKMLLDALSEGR